MVLPAVATLLMAASVSAETGRVRYVTDGDTFRLESGERIRIAGIDAPETHADQAHCRRELARGRISAERLRGMIDGRDVRFERVGRSYNRTMARVWIGDRDLGRALVAAGAARWWPRFSPKARLVRNLLSGRAKLRTLDIRDPDGAPPDFRADRLATVSRDEVRKSAWLLPFFGSSATVSLVQKVS